MTIDIHGERGDGEDGIRQDPMQDGHRDDEQPPYVVFGYGSLIFRPPPHVIKKSPGFLKGYVRRFAQKSHDHRGTPENPGRVVTLVHQEDWAAFSGADSFPHEDIVWGLAFTIDPAHAAEVRAYLDHREKDGYTLERVDVYGLVDGAHDTVVIPGAECYVGRNDNPSFSCVVVLYLLLVLVRHSDPLRFFFLPHFGHPKNNTHTTHPRASLQFKSWLGAVRSAHGYHLACRWPVGTKQGTPRGRARHLPVHAPARGACHLTLPVTRHWQDYVYKLAASVRELAPEAHDSHLFALEVRLRELDCAASGDFES